MNVLAIGAHPNDIALGCRGILVDHRERGDRVHVLVMTPGLRERNQLFVRRREEAIAQLGSPPGPDVFSPQFLDVSGPELSGPELSGPELSGPDFFGPDFCGPAAFHPAGSSGRHHPAADHPAADHPAAGLPGLVGPDLGADPPWPEIGWRGFEDGAVPDGGAAIDVIQSAVIRFGADLVYTHTPRDSDPDHRATARATVAACHLVCRVRLYETATTLAFQHRLCPRATGRGHVWR